MCAHSALFTSTQSILRPCCPGRKHDSALGAQGFCTVCGGDGQLVAATAVIALCVWLSVLLCCCYLANLGLCQRRRSLQSALGLTERCAGPADVQAHLCQARSDVATEHLPGKNTPSGAPYQPLICSAAIQAALGSLHGALSAPKHCHKHCESHFPCGKLECSQTHIGAHAQLLHSVTASFRK
jgi:hypothetical protein